MRFTRGYEVPRERMAQQEEDDRDGGADDSPDERRLRLVALSMRGAGDMVTADARG